MTQYEQTVFLWRKYNVTSTDDIDLRLHNFRIPFAFHSGKIENDAITYHDACEVFENGRVQNYTGDTRTLFELENQKTCYDFLVTKMAAKEPLTLDLIKETHAILTAGTYDERRFLDLGERPGTFKKHDFVTGVEEVGSLPEDVEQDMQDLLDELAENAGKDVLKLASYFHLRFEHIHPFADGNGRVGRTLMNYFLMTNNHPPIIIHEEDKAEYYTALEQYDKKEEMEPMYTFLLAQTCKTWEKTLDREKQREDEEQER